MKFYRVSFIGVNFIGVSFIGVTKKSRRGYEIFGIPSGYYGILAECVGVTLMSLGCTPVHRGNY